MLEIDMLWEARVKSESGHVGWQRRRSKDLRTWGRTSRLGNIEPEAAIVVSIARHTNTRSLQQCHNQFARDVSRAHILQLRPRPSHHPPSTPCNVPLSRPHPHSPPTLPKRRAPSLSLLRARARLYDSARTSAKRLEDHLRLARERRFARRSC